eukprot:PhM_4_TR11928/c0_g1_i1/m.23325/K20471/COPD, ARCN1, RET2; coatomer subunit delta
MTILSAAVLNKSGKILLSRQFVEMTRVRVEGLLAAFPKLVGSGQKQYTMLETSTVRYLYQPLEDLYLVIITTRQSNVVDDLGVLRLLGSIVPQFCNTISEEQLEERAFDILFAFDEVVAQGYNENITLDQVMQNLEMSSVEEEVAKTMKKKQMEEAAQHARDRAKAISKMKKEGMVGGGMGGADFQDVVNRQNQYEQSMRPEQPVAVVEQKPAVAPPSKGAMMLGKKKLDVASKVLGESGVPAAPVAPPTQQQGGAPAAASMASSEPVDLRVEEKISVVLHRDGGHSGLEVRGNLFVVVSDPKYSNVRITLDKLVPDFAFKTHAFINKNEFASDNILGLKDPGKAYPNCQAVEVLRWRLQKPDDVALPLSINCWPSENNVNVEFELEMASMVLKDVRICIPLGGAHPTSVTPECGEYEMDQASGMLVWKIPVISTTNSSGNMEVDLDSRVSPGVFFPTTVSFTAPTSMAGVRVLDVRGGESGAPAPHSLSVAASTESYTLQ